MNEKTNNSQIIFYQTENGETKIDVRFQEETVWLSQQLMADLFQTTKQNISLHIQNIYDEGELVPEATVKKYLTVRKEGLRQVKRKVDYYNLDVIISVGYRIKSKVATQFRKWATERLREYIVKGFVMDDERLKGNKNLPCDYFDELLERIRDIRASERRFYQKITDIYAQCSVDYDPNADITNEFYATVQNKLHWAIHGRTAAELITDRADADKPNMGLTTWKNAPAGKIRKTDIAVAKNYLSESELKELNLIVTMYLDYAEDQARRHKAVTMSEWITKLDAFLQFNERDILQNAGKVSAKIAEQLASTEFEKFKAKERQIESSQPVSDFDKFMEKTKKLKDSK